MSWGKKAVCLKEIKPPRAFVVKSQKRLPNIGNYCTTTRGRSSIVIQDEKNDTTHTNTPAVTKEKKKGETTTTNSKKLFYHNTAVSRSSFSSPSPATFGWFATSMLLWTPSQAFFARYYARLHVVTP